MSSLQTDTEKKILIVEDEFVVANGLQLILMQAGYKILGIADSVEDAESYLRHSRPDLAILDIRLNGKKSGLELAMRLKEENIAFIFLSANSSQKIMKEVRVSEPYGFIVKPFREKDLLVTVDIAFYRHQFSLESQLRREELLQKKIKELFDKALSFRQKFSAFGRIIQGNLPFDVFLMLHTGEDHINSYSGLLRTGFEEYQIVEKNVLEKILGNHINRPLLENEHRSAVYSSIEYHNPLKHQPPVDQLSEVFFNHFKVDCGLNLYVRPAGGAGTRFLLLSRQRESYTSKHQDLLERLEPNLRTLITALTTENDFGGAKKNLSVPRHRSTGFQGIIGSHPVLLSAMDLTSQVAPFNTSVLILGETGTGKERIAECIHGFSPRKNKPFVKVNCAAIPVSLMESELFGHEKGAFTDAHEKRKGKFELADGGTIFLDEVGDLPLQMQMKLLRVLQEREIDTVGGSYPLKIDVRVVAATNRDLEKEVALGNFRLDLYYRLNVFPIRLPALRERNSDIEDLANFFGRKFSLAFNKKFFGLSEAMLAEMQKYQWPGNVRELENVLERAVILNEGSSKLELNAPLAPSPEQSVSTIKAESLQDVRIIQRETEKAYLISVLRETRGRVRGPKGAAKILDLKATTLEAKIAKLNIKKDDFLN